MTLIHWFWLVVGAGVLLFLIQSLQAEKAQKGIGDFLLAQPDFEPSKTVISSCATTALGIDEARRIVCLCSLQAPGQFVASMHPYGDFLGAEIQEQDREVVKGGSGLGRAVVGGLALGVVGAAMGAASAKKTVQRKVSLIALRISVSDVSRPCHVMWFLSGAEFDTNGIVYQNAMQNALNWQATIAAVASQGHFPPLAPTPAPPPPAPPQQQPQRSSTPKQRGMSVSIQVADALRELAALRGNGSMSTQEYNKQKRALLGQ
ncbi:MAG: hypothetical protein HN742_10850 [Lentisphaerae bacterium]|jgi:hypothetical protein|nr:hypothetical protein [Lentisphaerota bacterium]MBT7842362.1 hypothetical protein [Lentisphaerota bacterium]